METVFSIRVDSVNPAHVRFTIFSGEQGRTRANIGSLCMTPLEYRLFARLLLGLEKPVSTSSVSRLLETEGSPRVSVVLKDNCFVKAAGWSAK